MSSPYKKALLCPQMLDQVNVKIFQLMPGIHVKSSGHFSVTLSTKILLIFSKFSYSISKTSQPNFARKFWKQKLKVKVYIDCHCTICKNYTQNAGFVIVKD